MIRDPIHMLVMQCCYENIISGSAAFACMTCQVLEISCLTPGSCVQLCVDGLLNLLICSLFRCLSEREFGLGFVLCNVVCQSIRLLACDFPMHCVVLVFIV